jgi:hypothetical protein
MEAGLGICFLGCGDRGLKLDFEDIPTNKRNKELHLKERVRRLCFNHTRSIKN